MTIIFYDRCCFVCVRAFEYAGTLVSKRMDFYPPVKHETCQSCAGSLLGGENYRVEVQL